MRIDDFLGKDFYNKYFDIYPIIRLIILRIDVAGRGMLWNYEFGYTKKSISDLIRVVPKWIICLSNLIGNSNRKDTVLLSDTILNIDRYDGVLNDYIEEQNARGMLKLSSAYRSNYTLHGINKKKWKSRTVFFGGDVTDNQTAKCVDKVYSLFEMRLKNDYSDINTEEIEKSLIELEKAINKRVNKICNVLKKNKVKLFLTINPWNVGDTLVIMACRKLGIWTKDVYHNAIYIYPIDSDLIEKVFFDENRKGFSCVNEIVLWGKEDLDHYNTYQHLRYNIFDEPLKLSVGGCIEVTTNQLKRSIEAYESKDKKLLTLFVPSYVSFAGNVYDMLDGITKEKCIKWRANILENVSSLARRSNLRVCLRYHPIEYHQIFQHKDIIEKYGFVVCNNSHEDLIKLLVQSGVVIMSGETSVMSLAILYGCKIYMINTNSKKYDLHGLDVAEIAIEDLGSLKICYNDEKKYKYDKCFDPNVVFGV